MKSMMLLLFVAASFTQITHLGSSHVRRTGHITLHGAVEKIFPLFGPLDEAKWAPGWEPSIKYGGNAELGTVFTTETPTHSATWIVTRYDGKSHDIQYTNVFPENRVVQLDIGCRPEKTTETLCDIAYAMTALNESGRQAIEHYTQEKHEERIAHWQMAINHYLQTGRRISPHD